MKMKAIGGHRGAAVRPIRASWRGTWTELSIRRSQVSSLPGTTIRSLHVGPRSAASPPLQSPDSSPLLKRRGREIDEGGGKDSVRRAVCSSRIGGKGLANGGRGGEGEAGRGANAGWSFGGKLSRRGIGWLTPRAAAEPDDRPSEARNGSGGGEEGRRRRREVITVDDLREEIASLQEEMSETQAKASAARNRFVRLTNAVERLQSSTVMAIREGDEATARRVLKEKSNVMNALEKSHRRAKVLEALAKKLGEMISRRETQLIVALTASSRSGGDGGSGIRSSSSSSTMHAGSTGAAAMASDQLQQTSASSVFYAGEPGEGTTVRGESTPSNPPPPPPPPPPLPPPPPSTSNANPDSNHSSTTRSHSSSRGSSYGGHEQPLNQSVASEGAVGGEEDYRCRQRDVKLGGGGDDTGDSMSARWQIRMPGVGNGEEGRGGKEDQGEGEEIRKEKEERVKRNREREEGEEEKGVGWERRERKMDEEELQARFLDMERSDLERMYQRSPELDPDSGRAAADHKWRTDDDYGSTTTKVPGRGGEGLKIDTSTLNPNDLSRGSITDGGDGREKSDENCIVAEESSQGLSHEREVDQKGDGDGRLTSTSKSGMQYLAEVDLQIALVKRKLDEIRRSIEEGRNGKEQEERAPKDHASRSSDDKLKAANLLLADLLEIRRRLSRLQFPGHPIRDEDLH
ncbi:hypothetical protein CBR_g17125 [Chara braunii]|uniref:Uncharacterized protein n=1 Tax=Chara braunii TaxID=69332 RepID=A0A388KUQ5_CHABU|nr:hypothetical protein CBR_g17125 [Chara braunii]|eukprot:GBG73786.1 hypothetical protein CBR_g17125 [Chara braunii]